MKDNTQKQCKSSILTGQEKEPSNSPVEKLQILFSQDQKTELLSTMSKVCGEKKIGENDFSEPGFKDTFSSWSSWGNFSSWTVPSSLGS